MSILDTSHSAGDAASAGGASSGADGSEEAVKVFVRIRPLNKRELAENQTIGWDFNETSMLEDTPNGQRVYAYDHCFGPTNTNQETYDIVGKPVVLKAMEGYNGTVFTYGQTGSGKTWTMRGCPADPGMMILCIRDILGYVRSHQESIFVLRVSYLEVYNEEINDLLGEVGSTASKNLKIVSEDATRGAVIGGLVEEKAETPEDFMAILHRGEASRSYASTEMNNESSRSHTIYRVAIEIKEKGPNGSPIGAGKISYLNLVDLAGSERQKSTKAEGKTLKEGANINKSLLALGAVINKLGDNSKKSKGKAAFIPYRDSKLTRILKQSLGGNTLTSILCAVTPAPMHREETVSTLKFGQSCKNIKNNVKSNDGAMDDKTLIRQYRNTINELRAQLEQYQKSGAIAAADPDSALGQALKEKGELEIKLRAFEANGDCSATGDGTLAAVSMNDEVARLSKELAEQISMVSVLQRSLEEFHDLEESKAAFEEYEQHCRQELDEDSAQLENEKQQLQNERYKLLKDRGVVDEKEQRIGGLITNLDEKESKLRQLQGLMREQQEQWQRSVTDLQRREDLVDDWQANHQQLERGLQDREREQAEKLKELVEREGLLSTREANCKINLQALEERAQRLAISEARVSTAEEGFTSREERLKQSEQALQRREMDSDIRDRELQSRRKEMESWDILLREKDRKIVVEQHKMDERERVVQSTEERIKQRDQESERRAAELRQLEQDVAEQAEHYKELLSDVQQRENETKERFSESEKLAEELTAKEKKLTDWERQLKRMQEKLTGIEEREMELNRQIEEHQRKEDEFFNVRVAQISARHAKELQQRDVMMQEQLKIASDFQRELESCKEELAQRDSQIEDLETALEQQNNYIESLKDQITLSDQESIYSMDSAEAPYHNNSDEDVDNTNDGNGGAHSSRRHGFVASSGSLINGQRSTSPFPASSYGSTGAVTNNSSGGGGSNFNDTTLTNIGNQHHNVEQSQTIMQRPQSATVAASPSVGVMSHNTLSSLPPEQQFLLQLATTHRALYNILAKNNAIPDQTGSRKRNILHSSAGGSKVADYSAEDGGVNHGGTNTAFFANGTQELRKGSIVSLNNLPDPKSQSDIINDAHAHASGEHQLRSYLPFRRVSSASAPDESAWQGTNASSVGTPTNKPQRKPSVPLISGEMSPDVVSTRRVSNLTIDEGINDVVGATSTAEEKINGSSRVSSQPLYARDTAASSAQRQLSPPQTQQRDITVPSQLVPQTRRRNPTPKIWGHHSISTVTNTPSKSRTKNTPSSVGSVDKPRGSSGKRTAARGHANNKSDISQQQSPQLYELVHSGRRNGIPVTTVNLGMSGGIRRAAAALSDPSVGDFSEFTNNLIASTSFSPDSHNYSKSNKDSDSKMITTTPSVEVGRSRGRIFSPM